MKKTNKLEKQKRPNWYIKYSKVKRRILSRHLKLIRTVLFSALIGLVLGLAYILLSTLANSQIANYANYARIFLTKPDKHIKSLNGKTNILVLGKAGAGHTAPDLTDTIIIASLDHQRNSADLISLPRDIWIEDLRAKLNSVYYWGNQKRENGGIALAKSTVEEITSLPIHYAVVIDFSGFEQIIDAIGGVDILIERGFTDEKYPIPGKENDECDGDPEFSCRYETITFKKGIEHMDGQRALKFVRSRQSEDEEEGTDFARAQRQQIVLNAIKDKVLSTQVALSPGKIIKLIKLSGEITETDLPDTSKAYLARSIFNSRNSISNHAIPEELFINPPPTQQYDELYVLIPENDDWRLIEAWVNQVLSSPN